MKKIYKVYYYHTFGVDEIIAENEEEVKQKAIEVLKKEFNFSKERLAKGVKITISWEKEKIAYSYEDFIESIEETDIETLKEDFYQMLDDTFSELYYKYKEALTIEQLKDLCKNAVDLSFED